MIILAKSLFNKDISPACLYCEHGRFFEQTNEVFCLKKGVTDPTDSCRKFRYDVLKRTPKRIVTNDDFKPEDFEL